MEVLAAAEHRPTDCMWSVKRPSESVMISVSDRDCAREGKVVARVSDCSPVSH